MMMTPCMSPTWSAAAVSAIALAIALPAQAQSRGELLYSTHCIACHSSQMHWRDKRLATDWNSLKAQVRRFQAAAMLGWNEEDIVEVTRYLNGTFYHFEQTSDPQSSSVPLPALRPAARLVSPISFDVGRESDGRVSRRVRLA